MTVLLVRYGEERDNANNKKSLLNYLGDSDNRILRIAKELNKKNLQKGRGLKSRTLN